MVYFRQKFKILFRAPSIKSVAMPDS